MTNTRIAIQVTGLPRFCLETDRLIQAWANYTNIDWYFALNKHYAETKTLLDSRWFEFTEEQLAEKIQEHLPLGHRVKLMTWVDTDKFDNCPIPGPGFYSDISSAWLSYKLAQYCNLLRRFITADQPKYDLVIRARLDSAPDSFIDIDQACHQAKDYPRALATSMIQRQGPWQFCDHLVWGSEEAMNLLADSVDWWPTAYKAGLEANPEILTGYVLKLLNLECPTTDWNSTLKTQGFYDDQGVFHPELGSWNLDKVTSDAES